MLALGGAPGGATFSRPPNDTNTWRESGSRGVRRGEAGRGEAGRGEARRGGARRGGVRWGEPCPKHTVIVPRGRNQARLIVMLF